ncbi:MAG: carbohydrate porin [Chlorogloeopsis fritschii C42_A2020_084]|uniref:iron uptake porin n=1 Tax=Chlorogloeopsis fritschii TaxID=1124 RepID=UPI0019E2926A|nr:iron uptake porin [Chlorogloeopsis fritschii]MBF2005049.1 carbohydrate porin [Chlorogloeopsis fritschii C42_A2020_084]
MAKSFWDALRFGSAILSLILILSNSTLANEVPASETTSNQLLSAQPEDIEEDNDSIAQVTSVSELSDVQPTDWAFGALQSLVERYGCIAGYGDRTYRGNRALNRYEFAAGLNACLERINQLLQTATDKTITEEDVNVVQRLQDEFAAELASVRNQIDSMEARTAQLEASPSFTTTSLFNAEAIIAVSGFGGSDIDDNFILSNRATLNFDTSFFGQDRLRVGIEARNTPDFVDVTGTNMSKLSFVGDNDNDFEISALLYEFNLSPQALVYLAAAGGGFTGFTPSLNAPLSSSSIGAVSNFGIESRIYGLNGGGTGVGFQYLFGRVARLSVGYLSAQANDPDVGIGGDAYGAIAQLTLQPTIDFAAALTYVHAYNISPGAGAGSANAENPFDGAATSVNAYGLETSYRVSRSFNLSGWLGLIDAHAESEPNKGSNATVLTWAVGLAFTDFLGRGGDLLGIIIGQPPKVIDNDISGREDPDTSLHFEAFYRHQITDRLYITPGFFVVTNPEHNSDNGTIYVGTLRTTFLF